MKVIGISGSPRLMGSTETLLSRALEGASSAGATVERLILNDIDFKPCQACGGCAKSGVCVLRDGLKSVYDKIGSADAVIIGSPVFFVSVSAQLKMMIDRFHCVWVAKNILGKKSARAEPKKGIFLSVASSVKEGTFDNAKSVIKAFFSTIDTDYSGELLCRGIDKRRDILKDKASLDKAFRLGRAIV